MFEYDGQKTAMLREWLGLSRRDVEAAAGLAFGILSRIEKEKIDISVRTAVRIAAALGVTLKDIAKPC